MKRLFYILLIASVCWSCARRLPSIVKDSTRIETRIVREFVRDTLYYEIPAQTTERLVKDSTSHIETDYAISDARIMPDGLLFHSLLNKPQVRQIPFDRPIVRKDSIVYRTNTETIIEKQEVIPKFYRVSTWALYIILTLFLLFILLKLYFKLKPL